MLVSSVWAGACSNLTNRTASDGTIDFILFAYQFILYLLSIKTSLAKSFSIAVVRPITTPIYICMTNPNEKLKIRNNNIRNKH